MAKLVRCPTVFDGKVLLLFEYCAVYSIDEMQAALIKRGIPQDQWPVASDWVGPGGQACVWRWPEDRFMVVCVDRNSQLTDIGTTSLLIHEAVHVFQRSMDGIGEKKPSREFEAYAIQRIAMDLLGDLHERLEAGTLPELT